ncbi:hypothetical protein SteCoe_33177 [Stentor coeruleus]|uniref:Uncharacterized protein n=1 Tax=Stentor coeruleus TaxID=5963 RepID=A0A1R2AXP6_9CILI|nr:hypothetical protein SteCoe_33177 [Stentor coeruleus]
MHSSRSAKAKRLVFSPEATSRKNDLTCNSEKSLMSCRISGHKQIVTIDPFSKVDKASPRCKLKPIILRRKASPNINRSLNADSIKIPDITEDGKIRSNRYILPSINQSVHETLKKIRVAACEEYKTLIPHDMSDSALQVAKLRKPNLEIRNYKAKERNELEMSFGYNDESINRSIYNPFGS